MKKFFAIAIACVTSSAAFAASLSDNQGKYLVTFLATNIVNNECRQMGYSLGEGRLRRFQDELGVDDRTALAVVAAAQLASDQKYNRADLIPEVTQYVKPALTWLLEEGAKVDFCKSYGDPLVKLGIMQKAP